MQTVIRLKDIAFSYNALSGETVAIKSISLDINDGEFEEHHPELSAEDDIVEQLCLKEEKQCIKRAIDKLTDTQKRRVIAYFFENKSSREIAIEEGVNYSKIEKSINLALKKLKNILSEGVQNASPSSNK